MLERRWIDGLLVAALAVAVYSACLGLGRRTEFTFDDGAIVAQNHRLDLDSWEDLGSLLRSKYWGDGFAAERLWRPLPLLTYAVDVRLSGRDPDGFHRTNVLIYVGLCLVVLWLFRRLVPRQVALLGALIFAAHPLHAEAVAGVVGRAEVLGLLGVAGGALLHLWARERGRWWAYPFAAAAFLAGFLSKESALTGPFLLIVVELVSRGEAGEGSRARRTARALAPYLLYAATLAGYFALRGWVLGEVFATAGARTLGDMGLSERLVVAALSTRDALLCMVLPPITSAHYELPFSLVAGPPSWLSAEVLTTCALHALALGGGALALRRPERLWRALGLGLWGTYLAFGPTSNVIPIGVVFADRILFAPSLWGALALACGVRLAARGRGPFVLVLAVVLVGFCARTTGNARAWSNSLLLWETSQAQFPSSPRVAVALGFELLGQRGRDPAGADGVLARARANFELALAGFDPPQRWPRQAAQARAGLALCIESEDPRRALDLLETAFVIDPRVSVVSQGLSQLYVGLAQQSRDAGERTAYLRKAEQAARHGTQISPHDYDLWVRLGSVLSYREHWREAEAAFTRASERRPRAAWEALWGRAVARHRAYAPPHLPNEAGALNDYGAVIEILRPAFESNTLTAQQREILCDSLLKGGALAGKLRQRELAVQWLTALQRAFPAYEAKSVRQLLEVFKG